MTKASVKDGSERLTMRLEVVMSDTDREIRPMPMAVGMILGALTGFALWIATDTFVFFPAFLGVGLALGLALGSLRRT